MRDDDERLPARIPARQMPWTWLTGVCVPYRKQRWQILVAWAGRIDHLIEEGFSLPGILRRPHVYQVVGATGARVKCFRLA